MMKRPLTLFCTCLLAWAGLTAASPAADPPGLPDLTARPAYGLQIGRSDSDSPDGIVLRFSVDTVNAGAYALDLLGVPKDATTAIAMQCVAWVARACTERSEVGELVWHPQHSHWHFSGFAAYEVRALDPNGLPDMSPQGLLGTGGKLSYCMEDTHVDYTQPLGDPVNHFVPFYAACTSLLQGISPGWVDLYDSTLAGQQVPVAGLPDGRYALVVRVNAERRLLESDSSNDSSVTFFDLFRDSTGLHVTEGTT